jgi:hypothetical protein
MREEYAFDWLTKRYKSQATMKNLSNADKSAVIVLGLAGTEGLNLAAADEVIFAERFVNPGKEAQAEDRINRPDQITPPRVTYMIPLEPFALAYSNRMEQKRDSILRTLGETPTSDYSQPLDPATLRRALLLNRKLFAQYFDPDITDAFLAELNPTDFTEFWVGQIDDTADARAADSVRESEKVARTTAARSRALSNWSPLIQKALGGSRALDKLKAAGNTIPNYARLVPEFFDAQDIVEGTSVREVSRAEVDAALRSGAEIVFAGYPVGLFSAQQGPTGDSIRKRSYNSVDPPHVQVMQRDDWLSALDLPNTGMVLLDGEPLTPADLDLDEYPEDYVEYLQADASRSGRHKEGYIYALNPRRKKNMARSRRSGKYADVWNKYGQKGFGIPTKAPDVGSYPLYPIGRARYALVLIASPSYDKKKGEREQIRKRALEAHPSLKSFWAERKKTIDARMKGRGRARMAANPSGQKQIVVRATSRSELGEMVPIAVDALMAMGAEDVKVGPMQRDRGVFRVRFTIEGLGSGRRFSSSQRKAFRRLVTVLLPSKVRAPSFQNATGTGFEAEKSDPLPGYRGRGTTPDSKRTARSKSRSKARRKTPRRLNSKSRR